MLPPVHIDFAKIVAPLIEDEYLAGGRNNLERMVGKQHARHAQRVAVFYEGIRILRETDNHIGSMAVPLGIELRLGPRLHGSCIAGKVEDIAAGLQPNSGKIRSARCGAGVRARTRPGLSEHHLGESQRYHQDRDGTNDLPSHGKLLTLRTKDFSANARRAAHYFSVGVSSSPSARVTFCKSPTVEPFLAGTATSVT